MTQVTIQDIETQLSALTKLVQLFKAQDEAPKPSTQSETCPVALQPGEHYVGRVLDDESMHLYHLVLMAEYPPTRLSWNSAMTWVKGIGGELPSRKDLTLLYTHYGELFNRECYWSSETNKDDASYAWCCTFDHGYQFTTRKSYDGCAVAVRRV